jgi:hypothetical protein
LWYPYERGFGLKIALANLKEGDGVGVDPFKSESECLMTDVEVAGGYVRQMWPVLGWAKGWQV